MQFVDVLEAKSSLSRLVEAIEQRRAREIIIARNGRPIARLVAIKETFSGPRIGIAKGKFEVPDNINVCNEEIAQLFMGEVAP